jgi:hypothetical protein
MTLMSGTSFLLLVAPILAILALGGYVFIGQRHAGR